MPPDRSSIGERWLFYDVLPGGAVNAIDNSWLDFEVAPRHALCGKCGALRPEWHPKPPPTVRLCLRKDVLATVGFRFPIVHRDLFELLRPHLPEAVVTACSSTPTCRTGTGGDYLVLGLPTALYVHRREPSWHHDPVCAGCGRRGGYGGPGAYYFLTPAQRERPVLVTESNTILVDEPRRRLVRSAFPERSLRWARFPVLDAPLPEHRVPEDGLGPAETRPAREPVKLAGAPRTPKKPRGGL